MELMHGDCLDLMKNIADKSIDMVLCDLPYGITQNKWDSVIPFEPLWEQYHRVCKENAAIVLFGKQPFTSELVTSNKKFFKYCWVWNKHYCRGFLNAKKMPLSCCEDIAVFYRKQCTYNPQMTKGVLRKKATSSKQKGCYGAYKAMNTINDIYYPKTILDFAGVSNPESKHPTQKPVPLLEYLIKTYTNDDETVLDNTMGSGSTGVACINTGRNFIGIEKDDHYFDIAKERIGQAEKEKAGELDFGEVT